MEASIEDVLLAVCAIAWFFTFVGAATLLPDVRALLRSTPKWEVRWWFAAVLVAALIRFVVPFDWVRVFTGWDLVGRIAAGQPIPKYGAGLIGLLRPFHLLTGLSPGRAIAVVNGTVGVLTVGGLAVAARAWLPKPRVLPAVAWALALLPVLIRHHRSEAALVVAFAAWIIGSGLWARWLSTGRHGYAWLAVAPWIAASHTRPALVLVSLITPWALSRWFSQQRADEVAGDTDDAHRSPFGPAAAPVRRARGPLVALLWGVLPQIVWLLTGAMMRGGRGDLPSGWSPWFVLRVPPMLAGMNAALWPHVFPVVLTGVGLLAAWRVRRQATPEVNLLKFTLTLGLLAILPGMADPVVVSMARLQAPWLALWAACAAAVWVAPAAPRKWVIAAVVLSAAATVPWLYQPENADLEDRLLADAAAKLAGKRGTLHWLNYDDAGADKVSRHYPLWRFQRPVAQLSLRALKRLPPDGTASDESPIWVLLGVRCYAQHRPVDAAPPVAFVQPACARAWARGDIDPVFERDLAHHGDVHFPWWPQQTRLKVGLYRLKSTPSPSP
ncbi:MAG: hypothetical protein KC502_03405 [Myxococcales bacterium]|nr:hypothetical protein [Myxococcales bacterium]